MSGASTPEQRRKWRARRATHYAMETGRLAPAPCERCGTVNVEAHHRDYDNPLDIAWLCRHCHQAEHGAGLRMVRVSVSVSAEALMAAEAIADRERCSVSHLIRVAFENELERRGYPIGRGQTAPPLEVPA